MEERPDLEAIRDLAASTPGFVRDHLQALDGAPPDQALPLLDALEEGLDVTLRAAVLAAHPGPQASLPDTLPDATLGTPRVLAHWARDSLLRRLDELQGTALSHRQTLHRLQRAPMDSEAQELARRVHARLAARSEEVRAALAAWARECARAFGSAAPPAPVRAPWPLLLERARTLADPAPAAARACLCLALEEGFQGVLDPGGRAPSFPALLAAAEAARAPLPLPAPALLAMHGALAGAPGPHALEGEDVVAWRLLDAVSLAVNRLEMAPLPEETRAALYRALSGQAPR